MRNSSGLVTGYRVMWLSFVVLFIGITLWLGYSFSPPRVDPENIKSAVKKQNPPPQTIQQRAGPLSAEMEGLDLVLSSSEGDLRMRLWAEKAHKEGNRFTISDGVLQFVTENQNTLLLEVDDGIYTQDDGVARIAGSIKGILSGSEQFFEATNVEWNQSENELRAGSVTFRSPMFEITGDEMLFDLLTGEVEFTGPVTAGV